MLTFATFGQGVRNLIVNLAISWNFVRFFRFICYKLFLSAGFWCFISKICVFCLDSVEPIVQLQIQVLIN